MPGLWRLVEWRLSRVLPPERAAAALGDLIEDHDRKLAGVGRLRAAWWVLAETRSLTRAYRADHARALRADGRPLQGIWQDARLGLRLLRREPGFAVAAILTLAICIGANVAIFSVLHGVIFMKPLLADPDEVVDVRNLGKASYSPLSPGDFLDLREGTRDAFSAFAATTMPRPAVLTDVGDARIVQVVAATSDIFAVMKAAPVLGRTLAPDDPAVDGPVVLAYRFWQSVLAGRRDVLGRTLVLDGVPHMVVGVLPKNVELLDTDLFTPLVFTAKERATRNSFYLQGFARLRPGVTPAQAGEALSVVTARIDDSGASLRDQSFRTTAQRLQEERASQMRGKVEVAQGAALLVLLIGCANLANLLLVRASRRRREFSVRGALGAARGRLARQVLTESLVLGVVGAAAGILVATWLVPVLVGAYPGELPNAGRIGVDLPALGVALGLSLLTCLVFGLAPAVAVSRTDLVSATRAAAASSPGRGVRLFRSGLVTAEFSLALVLLLGAGLLVRSFARLTGEPVGFVPDSVLTAEVTLPYATYSDDRRREFFDTLLDGLNHDPGVVRAAGATSLPFSLGDAGMALRNEPADGQPRFLGTTVRIVSREFFEALGTPIVQGRGFGPDDRVSSPRVAVVNESFAQRYGPAVIGLRLQETPTSESMTVVGVSADTRAVYNAPPRPEAYLLLDQAAAAGIKRPSLRLVVRTREAPDRFAAALRDRIRALDPNLPLTHVAALAELMSNSVAARRFNAGLMLALALIAAGLAALGIYGVTAYVVGLRTREVGIRLALGARRSQVRRLVARQSLWPLIAGCAIGLSGAWILAGLMRVELYRIAPHDARTFVTAGLVLCGIGLLASWLPTHRTARVDPASVLRAE
jgi:putative ABC transport system permease protein